jgi:hypothetical protein
MFLIMMIYGREWADTRASHAQKDMQRVLFILPVQVLRMASNQIRDMMQDEIHTYF